MLTPNGIRSLSPNEIEFESYHVYLDEDDPDGTFFRGDILVWTNQLLSDTYSVLGAQESLWELYESSSALCLNQGVTGALPEAFCSEHTKMDDFQTLGLGSPVHIGSTAGFVSIIYDGILGIDLGQGQFMSLSPKFPAGWEDVTVEIERDDGKVYLRKDVSGKYYVRQTNIQPYIHISLEVFPEKGARSHGSIQLYPDEEAEFKFVPTGDSRWQAEIRRL